MVWIYAHNMNKTEHWLQWVKHIGISVRVNRKRGWIEAVVILLCASHCLNPLGLNLSLLVLDLSYGITWASHIDVSFPLGCVTAHLQHLEWSQSSSVFFILSLAFYEHMSGSDSLHSHNLQSIQGNSLNDLRLSFLCTTLKENTVNELLR